MALGLYLHIPFCQSICSYCNFNRGLFDGDLKRRYVDAIEREIGQGPWPRTLGPRPQAQGPRAEHEPERAKGTEGSGAWGLRPEANTIFFGGGTPSLLDPADIDRLIRACADRFDLDPQAEITLETNPETATEERLEGFRGAGINRISFGVQSFDDGELARLGRVHSAARAQAAVRAAQQVGFSDVSFDLMFWLPGQSLQSWLRTIDQAIVLAPDHLSLYLLELYPNAPLKESLARAGAGAAAPAMQHAKCKTQDEEHSSWAQGADDEAAEMYLQALARLDEAGLEQYEISNVARPGHFSRHNVKYWQGESWLGFGCGAHSTVDGVRWKNVPATAEYIARVAQGAPLATDEHTLSHQERFEESLFTGLRLSAGVNRRQIHARFGLDPWDRYGERLMPFVEAGWMWTSGDRFGLTRQGMLVANDILTTFV